MRAIILLTFLFSAGVLKAQTFVPGSSITGYIPGQMLSGKLLPGDTNLNKKWSFERYAALSTGFSFFRGGSASMVSVPLVLQVNRRLNNNLYAFANVAAAPAYTNFYGSFMNSKYNTPGATGLFSRQNNLGLYTAASMGMMYVNDARTFSISGSITVESRNPFLPGNQGRNLTPARFIPANK